VELAENGRQVVEIRLDPRLLTNSLGMEFVRLKAGTFTMGSPKDEEGYNEDELQHEVTLTKDFYLGKYLVTQEEYKTVTGKNPSYFSTAGDGKDRVQGLDTSRFPVERVSWDEAVEFCERLSNLAQEKKAGRVYRLPTEAEWEYACRAGTKTPFWWGGSASSSQANFNGNYPYGGAAKGQYQERTTKVGSFEPNLWGLYDMHGNVWEWCGDWYDENYYRQGDNKDPQGQKSGNGRVLRGGSWYGYGWYCRAADRSRDVPGVRSYNFGFRVALALPPRTP